MSLTAELEAIDPELFERVATKLASEHNYSDHDLTAKCVAARLHCDEKEVRRLLDPRHASKMPRLESALAVLGQQLVVGLQAAV